MWRAFTVKGTCRKHPCTERVVFRVSIGLSSCYSSFLLFPGFRLQVLRGSPAMLPERCPLQAGAAACPVQLQLCSSCKHQLWWDLRFILGNVLVCFHTGNHRKTFPANKKQVLLTVEPDRVNKDCGTSTVYQCGSFCLEDAADLCQQRFCECDGAAIDCMTQSPYNSSLRGLADTSCSATNQTGETKRSRLQSQHLATVFGSFGCLVTSLMFYKEHIYSASFSVPETTASFCTSALQARK